MTRSNTKAMNPTFGTKPLLTAIRFQMFLLPIAMGFAQPRFHFLVYFVGLVNQEMMHLIARRNRFISVG